MPRIAQFVPQPLRPIARNVYLTAVELVDRLPHRRNSLYPLAPLDFVGGGDYETTGREFLKHHIEIAGLRPDESILDVGCGIGRMAAPLTSYLSIKGQYDGFDIVKRGVRWATHHITRQFPNFRFHHVDVYNQLYNAVGKVKASEYQFPFADNSFDYVFLTSVFTHMLPTDVEHYLSEIGRVLKSGGRALITYFLLNDESLQLLESGKSAIKFVPYLSNCRTERLDNPTCAIAYDEAHVRQSHAAVGLSITEPIYYGSWSGREKYTSYQDITLSTKL